MGYDYTLKTIMRHEQEVLQLIEAWKKGETLKVSTMDAETITKYQKLIRSLLASIDLNYEDCHGIRRQRTWITRDPETNMWTLYIGATRDKQTGRRPAEPYAGNVKLTNANMRDDTVRRTPTVTEFMHTITSEDDMAALINFVISEMSRGTKYITATALLVPDETEHSFFFNALAQMGWNCYIYPGRGTSKTHLELKWEQEEKEDDVTRAFDEELRKLQGELP